MKKQRLRIPAWQAPKPPPALALDEDPTERLQAHFQRVFDERMHDLPFINPALSVEIVGFRRWQGDWLGAAVTPWALNLILLPGGGTLWSDQPTGERTAVSFPVGALDFIADHDASADPPASQYCPLFTSVTHFISQAAAREAAHAALAALFETPATPPASSGAPTSEVAPAAPVKENPAPARRAFFRRIAGR